MENLRCPYCGGEMQKGWLRSRRLGGHHPAPAAYPAPACAGLFSLPQPYRSFSRSGATHFCPRRQKWAKTPFKPAV